MKNSKSLFIITIGLALFINEFSMAQNWDWSVSAGGKQYVLATGMVNDADGNLYVTGSFNGTATFGSQQLTSTGASDIFLAKYDPFGKLLWIKQAGGTDDDEANSIVMDANNNI